MNFEKDIISGKTCPYCGCKSKYVDSSVIYGRSYGMVYRCEPCDAFVGVHHKTSKKALGRLANRELREWKKKAHSYFDQLWKRGLKEGRIKHEVRSSAYKWLANELEIKVEHCHIGMFDIELCRRTIEACKPYCE